MASRVASRLHAVRRREDVLVRDKRTSAELFGPESGTRVDGHAPRPPYGSDYLGSGDVSVVPRCHGRCATHWVITCPGRCGDDGQDKIPAGFHRDRR